MDHQAIFVAFSGLCLLCVVFKLFLDYTNVDRETEPKLCTFKFMIQKGGQLDFHIRQGWFGTNHRKSKLSF